MTAPRVVPDPVEVRGRPLTEPPSRADVADVAAVALGVVAGLALNLGGRLYRLAQAADRRTGARSCATCGCTDRFGCLDGCGWALDGDCDRCCWSLYGL